MKQVISIFIISIILLAFTRCGGDTEDPSGETNNGASDTTNVIVDTIQLDLCTCLDSLPENAAKCETQFGIPQNELDSIERHVAIKLCKGEEILGVDTMTRFQLDSAKKAYEADLSLEIKEIEEEKEDPISEECKLFLEEYADAIKSFKSFADKLEKSPDDINLLMARSGKEEELYGYASKPQMFSCSQTESFKTQVEILNTKRDKLIEN